MIKRDGRRERVATFKIKERLDMLVDGLNMSFVNLNDVVNKVTLGLCDNIKTSEIDEFCAQIAASLTSQHPDYGRLAARIGISNLHKKNWGILRQENQTVAQK